MNHSAPRVEQVARALYFGGPLGALTGSGGAVAVRRPLPAAGSRSGRPFAAVSLLRSDVRGLLRRDAAVRDVSRSMDDPTLIRPDQTRTASLVDRDRDRVGKVAVSRVQRAENAVRA